MVSINNTYFDRYYLMRQALKEAKKGLLDGEVPVGAVLAGLDGKVIGRAHNRPIALNDPMAHAEVLAMREAALYLGNYRLSGTVLVVTIEPCIMCMGAAIQARVPCLVFGAVDEKAGAAGSLYDLATDPRLNHRIDVISGVMESECRGLMQDFFRARRERMD